MSEHNGKPRPSFRKLPETEEMIVILRDELRKSPQIAAEEVARRLRVPVEDLRRFWGTTHKVLRDEYDMLVERVNGKFVLLDTRGKHLKTQQTFKSANRAARERMKDLHTIDVGSLDPDQLHVLNADLTCASVLETATSRRVRRLLESKVKAAHDRLPVDATIVALLGMEKKNGDGAG